MKYAVIATVLMFSLFGAVHAAPTESQKISPHPLGERSIFSDRAVAERIQPVGSVCVEGEPCATGAAGGEQVAAAGPRPAEKVYNSGCAACHASGAAGAPVTGDKAAWAPRIDKGMDTLVNNAWSGIGAMPPKGMCSDCSKEEIRSAVEYMVEKSR